MKNEKFILNTDNKRLAALSEIGYQRDENHKYILFSKTPPTGFLTQAASLLTNFYLRDIKQSLKKWREDKKGYTLNWHHPKTSLPLISKQVSYNIFSKELRESGEFEPSKFNLPLLECFWLDRPLDFSMNFHFFGKNEPEALTVEDATPQMQYGESYPIKPRIDREGHIFTTFQPQLIKRIIRERKALIENSENSLSPDWILDLRGLINDSISLIDITLTQIYIKAQYSPESGWNFDPKILGQKNGRRLKDKLKWIRQITGNPLNIEKELPKLERLRLLRNHLNHFDPPTLVLTLEEAVELLNDTLYIGQILVKIREALNVPVSNYIIDLLLQPEAIFNPEKAFKERLPFNRETSGYSTSIWKLNQEEDD